MTSWRTATGRNAERLEWTTWNTADLKGRRARIRIIDQETGGWGHINVDQIVLTDRRWTDASELMSSRAEWG